VLKAVAKPQPAFPAEALRDGVLNGRVTVTYTVQPDGTVADVRIVSAEPQQVFNRAARNAVARWRFEPIAQTTQGTVEFVFDATR
jgi:protein TonB